ncbi:MAG TPA: hypothetical protein PLO69_11245 [Gammaproteobacteria bacterium]|nr:hypothetical protein [Gammaproteobacteria bacterium]
MRITQTSRQAKPIETADAQQTRQRLFTFLASPDGSIEEIRNVTRVRIGDLADWMVGIYRDGDDIAGKVKAALDQSDALATRVTGAAR